MDQEELLKKLRAATTEGDEDESAKLAAQAIDNGLAPLKIIRQAISPAMDDVGAAFESGDAFLPELILAGDAARAALDQIVPHISVEDQSEAVRGTVVIGTIFGDAHDIGKNIVIAIMAAYGLKVIDLGINVAPKEYIEAAIKEDAQIIAISSLITTSLPYHREIINLLKDRGLRERFFVMVGGGPVTPEWTAEIGADGYGRDAKDAAAVAQDLLAGLAQGNKPPRPEPVMVGALKHG